MGVLLVPRSQDLRNERLKVESCNILFKANYPTKEMWSSDVMDSKNEMWWCKGFQYEKIFPCSDLFMGDNIEREYSLLNNTPEEMQ